MALEVLIEGCERRSETLALVDASSEADWLKSALRNVCLLDRPFAVQFESETEAEKLAERLGRLGFQCRVWSGPDPNQRVGKRRS
jgi:hypothetical protein